MRLAPAKLKNTLRKGRAPASAGPCWSDPPPPRPTTRRKQEPQERPYSAQEVHGDWKKPGAFSPKHSPLPISCVSADVVFPFYSLQNIVRFGILGKALKTSTFGLTNSNFFFKLMMSVKYYLQYFNSSFNYSFEGISCMYVFRVLGSQVKHFKYLRSGTITHTLINMFSSLQ